MILRETLGLSADGSTKAYKSDDIKAFFEAVPLPLTYNPRRPQTNQFEFFVRRARPPEQRRGSP